MSREAAEFANKAVEDAALVADAARADELAAKREMFDLRQQLTEQLTSSCQVANAQDATIHSLYSQLEVCTDREETHAEHVPIATPTGHSLSHMLSVILPWKRNPQGGITMDKPSMEVQERLNYKCLEPLAGRRHTYSISYVTSP